MTTRSLTTVRRPDDVDRGSGESPQLGGGGAGNQRAQHEQDRRASLRGQPAAGIVIAGEPFAAVTISSRGECPSQQAREPLDRDRQGGRFSAPPTASHSRPVCRVADLEHLGRASGAAWRRPERVVPVGRIACSAMRSLAATWCLRCTEAARAVACPQTQRMQARPASRCRPPSPHRRSSRAA